MENNENIISRKRKIEKTFFWLLIQFFLGVLSYAFALLSGDFHRSTELGLVVFSILAALICVSITIIFFKKYGVIFKILSMIITIFSIWILFNCVEGIITAI